MKYIKFVHEIQSKKLLLFTLQDAMNLFPRANEKSIKNNLNRWYKTDYINRLRRGLYEWAKGEPISDLYVANRLYEPSYVSCEAALSLYGMIPEVTESVTSVTPLSTRTFRNKYGLFYYRSIQKRAFIGYRLTTFDECQSYIADKEKALVDFLYYRSRSGLRFDVSEERFNMKILSQLNWKKASRYQKNVRNWRNVKSRIPSRGSQKPECSCIEKKRCFERVFTGHDAELSLPPSLGKDSFFTGGTSLRYFFFLKRQILS